MNPSRVRRILLAAALLAPLAAARAAPQDLAAAVEQAVEEMQSGDLSAVYEAALDLADRGEAVVPLLHRRLATEEDPFVILGLVRALADLDAADPAAERLAALLGDEYDDEVRLAAADLATMLPDPDGVAERLADQLDRAYDPALKAGFAKALYRLGDPAQKIRATDELKSLLKSENRAHRITGALALAEIGAMDAARPVLLEIENDPDLAGRLARAYLQIERINRYWENRESRLLLEREGGRGGDDNLDLIREIIDLVEAEHIDGESYKGREGEEKLLTAAAKGLLARLDRHSTYFSPEEYERWLLDLQRDYAGIGAYVQTIDGWFTITRPIYSGPAFRAGLRSNDRIIKVDGWETYNKPQQEVIDRLKAEPGTKVEVEVMRAGWKKPRKFVITREVIQIPSVKWELFPGDVGYIECETFGDKTHAELERALEDLTSRGARGFVLDLRFNPGGYMREAIAMVGEFVGPRKLVLYTEGRHAPRDRREYYTPAHAVGRDEPLCVLVNGQSASASEIVSGALKHYGRALLVGERTFGKGSVQNPFGLRSRPSEPWQDRNRNGVWDPGEPYQDENGNGKFDYGAMVKLTTQLYYLPNGRSIHTRRDADGRVVHEGGVEPDIEVEFRMTEPWKEEELADLVERDVFNRYIDEHFEGNEDLFVKLAEGDDFDWSRYPDFDEFYRSLNTHLDRDEIRRWLRLYLRYKVADLRKKPFPGNQFLGDYQEDTQLQRAIYELLKKMGRDPAEVPEYRRFVEQIESSLAEAAKAEGASAEEGGG